MGIRAVVASLVLHAGVALLLDTLRRSEPVRAEEATVAGAAEPIEIAMIPMVRNEKEKETETEAETEAEAEAEKEKEAEKGRGQGRRLRRAEPASTGNPDAMRMRPVGTQSSGESEVVVPRAWQLGKVEGAPPANELPPGALGGPVRAPRPFVPSSDPTGRALGHGVEADGDGGYREERGGYSSRIDRDGSIHFKDKSWFRLKGFSPVGMPSLLFSMDLTDAVMRALGDDPYAYEKMKIMEETREVRAGMALRERSDRFREAQSKLGDYLEKIWAFPRFTLIQKRQVLFALWEEAAEDGDPELQRYGAMARATIEAFIRRKLPEGAPHAYSDAELVELNRARKSRKRFEPYAR